MVKHVHNDVIEDAVFEIEGHHNKLSCVIRLGIEQLPSFEKKLSELSLQKFDLPEGENIYDHAETIVGQAWPNVNYNFPMVHTDKFDTTTDNWAFFEKIINKRVSGAFLVNTVDLAQEIFINRNIIQPLPYLMHVLQRGMIDSGLTLSGNILSDPNLTPALIYGDVEYYSKAVFAPIYVLQMSEDRIQPTKFKSISTLPNKGKYQVSGTINNDLYNSNQYETKIKYRNQILYWDRSYRLGEGIANNVRSNRDINLFFETINDGLLDELIIESDQSFTVEEVIFDISIEPILLHDPQGNAIPSIINRNSVDLKKASPDIYFSDVVKNIKNWFNYDLTVVGKLAIMNKIEGELKNNEAIDLSNFEVEFPKRKFNQGFSFLLKFQEVENKEFVFLPVFQNNASVVNSNFKTNEKTTTIEIQALPLPILTRTAIQTAFAIEQNNSKMFLVPYSGLTNGDNVSMPINQLLLPEVHQNYWKKWFSFRIDAHQYITSFKTWLETSKLLSSKKMIYMYGNYQIIKTISKTEISPDLFEVEIESETI